MGPAPPWMTIEMVSEVGTMVVDKGRSGRHTDAWSDHSVLSRWIGGY